MLYPSSFANVCQGVEVGGRGVMGDHGPNARDDAGVGVTRAVLGITRGVGREERRGAVLQDVTVVRGPDTEWGRLEDRHTVRAAAEHAARAPSRQGRGEGRHQGWQAKEHTVELSNAHAPAFLLRRCLPGGFLRSTRNFRAGLDLGLRTRPAVAQVLSFLEARTQHPSGLGGHRLEIHQPGLDGFQRDFAASSCVGQLLIDSSEPGFEFRCAVNDQVLRGPGVRLPAAPFRKLLRPFEASGRICSINVAFSDRRSKQYDEDIAALRVLEFFDLIAESDLWHVRIKAETVPHQFFDKVIAACRCNLKLCFCPLDPILSY